MNSLKREQNSCYDHDNGLIERCLLARAARFSYMCDADPSSSQGPAQVAAIAQPVEHIIRNDGVAGSNPACGTTSQRSATTHRLARERVKA